MIRITFVTFFIFFILQSMQAQSNEYQTTYYLIRHAEKLRTNPNDSDPDLSPAGIIRSQKWNEVFSNIVFDEIYATNYKRTIKTAEPIARKHQINITKYHPKSINFDEFKESTKNKTVLIVGHSNTIPEFVNELIGIKKYDEIDDSNNSNLYIVTIKNKEVSHLMLQIDMESINE